MADWKQIPDTDVDPDAPVTSELMYALRDNPVAIAEGAVGAPRVEPKSLLSSFLGGASGLHSTQFLTILNCEWVRSIQITGTITKKDAGTTASPVQISYSANGGASWGPWLNFLPIGSVALPMAAYFIELDITTGQGSAIYGPSVGMAFSISPSLNHNAFRIRANDSSQNPISAIVYSTGGRVDV